MLKLAVVLLNYNGESLLERFLPGVLQSSPSDSVYLIDNASTDESLVYLSDHLPADRLITLERNQGYAGGYNAGLAQISAEYYVLLNTDVEVKEGWWAPMLSFMEHHPEVGACQPKMLAYGKEPPRFDYAGAAGGYIDLLGYPYCRGRIFETIEEDRGQYDGVPMACDWASGACCMVRASAFWEVGAFDASFFMHMEEIDLCWRLHEAGYKVYCCADASVSHLGGGTLPMHSSRKVFYNLRNNLLLLYKHLPLPRYVFVMGLRLILDLLALLYLSFRGRFKAALAMSFAYGDALRLMPRLQRRPGSRASTLAYPRHRVYVLSAYFLQAKRVYTLLVSDGV